jgi:hypothetical protein
LRGWRRKAWGFKSPLPHQRSDFVENDFVIRASALLEFSACG